MNALHLKFKTPTEIRRISINSSSNLATLRENADKLILCSPNSTYSLKYEDEDKDKISIVSEADWREAVSFAETQGGNLVLYVGEIIEEPVVQPPPAIPSNNFDDELSKLEKEFIFLSAVDLPQAKEVIDQALVGAKDFLGAAKEKIQTIIEDTLPKAQNDIQNFLSQNGDMVVSNIQNFVQAIEQDISKKLENLIQKDEPALYSLKLVKDVTFPDGTVVPPNTPFTKTWQLKNDGNRPWPRDAQVKPISAIRFSQEPFYEIPSIEPDQSIDFSIEMVSPSEPGKYRSFYRLFHPDSNAPIGDIFWVDLVVPTPFKFQEQLNQLIDMGFDESVCRFLLEEHNGVVEECMFELTQ